MLARGKLAALGLTEPVRPGLTTGRFAEAYSWTWMVTVEPIVSTGQTWRAYWVEVAVSPSPPLPHNMPPPVILRTVKLIPVSGND